MAKVKQLLIFTGILALLCGIYVLNAPPQTPLPHNTWRHEVGELLGSAAVWLFVVIYGRTALKILLRQGALLDRLLPEGAWDNSSPRAKKLLSFLNTTHPFVGVATVLLILCHALLGGLNQANLLMQVVLGLIIWQFGFGLFLLVRYQQVFVQKIKRYSYLVHSQLYTGIALGLFAMFGHLLIKD